MVSFLQTFRIQQKIKHVHDEHAVVVVMRCGGVFRDDDFLEEVARQEERSLFLLFLLRIRHRERRLDVAAFRAFVADEINLELAAGAVPVRIFKILSDDADIDAPSANLEFVEDDVLHRVRLFNLAEIEACIAQAEIGEIIFRRRVDVPLALDIVADGLVDEERIAEIVDIILDGRRADRLFLDAMKRR